MCVWWGGSLPLSVSSIPPAHSLPVLLKRFLPSSGVSGPSRAADCLWQQRYFKSGVWAKLEWAIPPVPAEGPLRFAPLLHGEELGRRGGVGIGRARGGQKSCYLQPSKPLFHMQSAQLAPLWGGVSAEQSWMFAALFPPHTSSLSLYNIFFSLLSLVLFPPVPYLSKFSNPFLYFLKAPLHFWAVIDQSWQSWKKHSETMF